MYKRQKNNMSSDEIKKLNKEHVNELINNINEINDNFKHSHNN